MIFINRKYVVINFAIIAFIWYNFEKKKIFADHSKIYSKKILYYISYFYEYKIRHYTSITSPFCLLRTIDFKLQVNNFSYKWKYDCIMFVYWLFLLHTSADYLLKENQIMSRFRSDQIKYLYSHSSKKKLCFNFNNMTFEFKNNLNAF